MRLLSGFIVALLWALVASPAALRAEEPVFAHQGVASDAERYETYVRTNWRPDQKKAPDLRLAGDKQMSADPRAASRSYAQAVATDPKSPEAWLGLARALLAIKTDPEKGGSEQYDLPVNASGAAYRAYQLSKDAALKARALAVLGEAMERRAYWRPAIDALKVSLALAENASVRETYEKLRSDHGFRMTNYSTEQDTATPRVCIVFSENLSRNQSDFTKFVSLDGKDPQSVTAEGLQLCIDGLEHGKRYEIKVRAGLPSDVGEPLAKDVTVAVYVPDRKPMAHFTGKNYVLPSRGQQGIPVVSINTSKIAVEVYRIGDRNLANALANEFSRQLDSYEFATIKDRSGSLVYTGELEVASKLNAEVTTAFPVSEAIGQLEPGAYVMAAHPADLSPDDNRTVATQWFIVSDLGLTSFTGADGIHAFVRSLAGATAIDGANVRLIARNNEVLATAKSDKNGYVRFEPGQSKGVGGLEPQILVAEKGPGEYAFLDLSINAFDLSDRGVKGREAPGPIDAYLYTERGVYRPGEEVNFTGLARDNAGRAATLPLTLVVSRPDGVEYGRYTVADEGLGGRHFALKLGGGVMTGTWRAKLHTDPKEDALTQTAFMVEDFVPERLDMTLTEGEGKLSPTVGKTIDVAGRFLYGPPAANLALEGDIVVKPASSDLEGFPGYKFGAAEEAVSPVRQQLADLPETGADGTAKVAISLPTIEKTAKPLEANIALRLRESGGRSIERSITLPVSLGEARIGVKGLFPETGLGEGEKAAFNAVVLDADNKAITAKLNWQLVRLETSWQWYSRDGAWTYEAQTISRKVATGTADATATKPAEITADVKYGRYRLELSSPEAPDTATSMIFNAGWYVSDDTENSPEILDVALDKPSYKTGDVAKLRIASKQGGRALIAVLGNGLLTSQEVDVPKGGADVEIPVSADWGPGAYATALLYRPMDEAAKRMPSRAIGIRWIGVDQSPRTLKVSLAPEAKIKSGATLTVPVKVQGLTAGEEARIAVAAVDLGILNLTRYEIPAPEQHFYAQRKLAVELRDFYGRLIDGMRAERGKLRSGGDIGESEGLKGTPPVEETIAFYSGIVKVGADGTATVDFVLPPFNGTVRVMAVAWSNDKLGHGTTDVIVRNDVALTASAPRFLTLGDEARIELSLHNVEGPAGAYKAVLADTTNSETSIAERSIDLKQGERKAEVIAVKPADVGLRTYDVRITGPAGITASRRLTFDVKPPAGDIKRTTVLSLAAKGGKLSLSKDLIDGLIANRTRVNLSVGPNARMDVPGLLTSLDRYPYGCAEQTVSRALPLLYANEVAAQIGIAPDKELKARVQAAIDRVFEMQDASGAFGIWGPTNGDLWLTSYVADFLTRAKESGYAVRPLAFTQALDRLQNFALNGDDFQKGGEERAYALYVLARNGRAPVGELRYYSDTRMDRFTTPLAKAQIGAALAMVGDKERAEAAFKGALAVFDANDMPVDRSDYGSEIRDGAAIVTLASETGIAKIENPRLVNVVSKAYIARRYTSTQEQAWMLLAAHALGERTKGTRILVGGAPVEGSVVRQLSAEDVAKGLTITNDGDEATDAVITVIGASLEPEPAIAKGFTIERSFFTLDGKPMDLASASGGKAAIKQNDRFVAVLKITSDEAAGRVLLADRLPAGLEIDNPHLVDSADIKTLDWLKTTVRPEHTEFRDDRFVAAFNLWGSSQANAGSETETSENESTTESDTAAEAPQPEAGPAGANAKSAKVTATVAYIVRAVTPGTYVHPAATIEDMYRPERYARSPSGTLTVTAKE